MKVSSYMPIAADEAPTCLKDIVNIYQLPCSLLKSSHVVQRTCDRGHGL